MITKTILSGVRAASLECRRNFGVMVPAMQKVSDPIQQLFLDKLREYKSKSKYVIHNIIANYSMKSIEIFHLYIFVPFFARFSDIKERFIC